MKRKQLIAVILSASLLLSNMTIAYGETRREFLETPPVAETTAPPSESTEKATATAEAPIATPSTAIAPTAPTTAGNTPTVAPSTAVTPTPIATPTAVTPPLEVVKPVTYAQFSKQFVQGTTYQYGIDPTEYLISKGFAEADFETKATKNIRLQDALMVMVSAMQGQPTTKEKVYTDATNKHLLNNLPIEKKDLVKELSKEQLQILIQNYNNIQRKIVDVKKHPIESFLQLPDGYGYSLSWDGNYLFYCAPWKQHFNLFVKEIKTGEITQLTFSQNGDVSGIFTKEDYILYMKDMDGDENYHIFRSDVNGDEEDITPYANTTVEVLDALNVKNEILITMNKDNKEVFTVYRLNVVTGALKKQFDNTQNFTQFLTDNKGALRLAGISDGLQTSYYYRENEKEPFKFVKNYEENNELYIFMFDKDNKTGYGISNVNRNTNALVQVDLATGNIIKEIYSDPEYDIETMFGSNVGNFGGVVVLTDTYKKVYFDHELESLENKIRGLLNTTDIVNVSDFSEDYGKVIVSTYSDVNYGMYYLYDQKKNTIEKIGDLNTIPRADLAEMMPVSYKSRDGMVIHGYLTLPQNKESKNLPLIVNPHGGPWVRDSWGYNPEVQMLANQGFAVFQMNFRGSTGYGKKFVMAGNKQWGLKMQDDITDGVQWLIDIGVADSARVGIYGASYGGFATLSGITKTPDLYAAAVDYVGVSNLFTFMDTVPPYWKSQQKMMYERVGNPVTDKEMFEQVSPVFHADKIKTPLMIAQGGNDPRVNKAEAEQMIEALKQNNIPYEYLYKADEGHGFTKYGNQVEFYTKMIAFFNRYLQNGNEG